MAAGIVVVGRNANGANFCMRHEETSLVANTPEEAARALRRLEDDALRERLARGGHRFIQRYFAHAEPTRFWRELLRTAARDTASA
jgi:hypothetical protein